MTRPYELVTHIGSQQVIEEHKVGRYDLIAHMLRKRVWGNNSYDKRPKSKLITHSHYRCELITHFPGKGDLIYHHMSLSNRLPFCEQYLVVINKLFFTTQNNLLNFLDQLTNHQLILLVLLCLLIVFLFIFISLRHILLHFIDLFPSSLMLLLSPFLRHSGLPEALSTWQISQKNSSWPSWPAMTTCASMYQSTSYLNSTSKPVSVWSALFLNWHLLCRRRFFS